MFYDTYNGDFSGFINTLGLYFMTFVVKLSVLLGIRFVSTHFFQGLKFSVFFGCFVKQTENFMFVNEAVNINLVIHYELFKINWLSDR